MDNKPLVSVVLTIFNGERFLREAIDSVVAQTYPHWELLLVDDGSTDESPAIAREYLLQHPERIRYLEHEHHANRGVSVSRNLAIENARGEFIAPLNGDDAWFPQKLQEQVAMLQTFPEASLVFGNRLYWYSWAENPTQADFSSSLGFAPNVPMKPPQVLMLTFARGSAASPIPTDLMFHRETAKRLWGFEETINGIYEDQPFLTKVFLNEVVVGSDAIWSKYRIRPDSLSFAARTSGKWEEEWVFFLEWFEKYLVQRNKQPQEIWQALQKRLFPYRHPFLNKLLQPARQLAKAIQQKTTE